MVGAWRSCHPVRSVIETRVVNRPCRYISLVSKPVYACRKTPVEDEVIDIEACILSHSFVAGILAHDCPSDGF
jgi:hypothetical protein